MKSEIKQILEKFYDELSLSLNFKRKPQFLPMKHNKNSSLKAVGKSSLKLAELMF